jgi:excisionase family DNA binding protein
LWCIAFVGGVNTMVDTIYTIEQAAEILHIKPRTLREWIRQEKVKAFKLGGLVRIHEEDLQEFIDSARKKVRNTERREMEGHDHISTETA